jgi:hypothetical protein
MIWWRKKARKKQGKSKGKASKRIAQYGKTGRGSERSGP